MGFPKISTVSFNGDTKYSNLLSWITFNTDTNSYDDLIIAQKALYDSDTFEIEFYDNSGDDDDDDSGDDDDDDDNGGGSTGYIWGKVWTKQGIWPKQPLQGAQVTIPGYGTQTTDSNGYYEFDDLPKPQTYTLTCTSQHGEQSLSLIHI